MPQELLAGKRAVATIDGEPMAVTDGSYTTTSGVDEMTNLLSGGYYDDVATIKSARASLTLAYDGLSPPEFDEGDIIALSIAVPGTPAVTGPPAIPGIPSGPGIEGNWRVDSMTWPIVNPKGGVRYSFDCHTVGPYTKTTGGVVPTESP